MVNGKAFSWASVQRHIADPTKIYAFALDMLRIPAMLTIPLLLLVTWKVKVGCRRLVSYSWTMIQALWWRSMQIDISNLLDQMVPEVTVLCAFPLRDLVGVFNAPQFEQQVRIYHSHFYEVHEKSFPVLHCSPQDAISRSMLIKTSTLPIH